MIGALRVAGILAALLASGSVLALEYPIGKPQNVAGMEIGAVYLQPVDMDFDGHMRKAAEADVHLEADIHALADDPNGYPEGAWIGYLQVHYEIMKLPSGAKITGDFMPMVASDGPHYGDNAKLAGPGRYKVTYTIQRPNAKENPGG